MRLNPLAYGLLVVVLFTAPIAAAVVAGAWQTTGGSGMGDGRGAGAGAGAEQGQGRGSAGGPLEPGNPDPMDVRGRTAIGDVAAAWGIPLAEIVAAFDLPIDTLGSTLLRDLESETFSVAALRDWLAAGGGG
jgi:hypothetical protein